MTLWQADFYHHFPQREIETNLWQLLICDQKGNIIVESSCPQSQVNSQWLIEQIQSNLSKSYPEAIAVFRPQSLSLFSLMGQALGIKILPTRRTDVLKRLLLDKYYSPLYNPLKLEASPPQSLPENLWGKTWRFASFPAGEIIHYFRQQPIPILSIDSQDDPLSLGLPSHHRISGIVIEGDRKAMILARWLAENHPYSLNFIPTEIGQSGGLILESGLSDRWVLVTFEDPEMATSAQQYEQRKQENKGLHFLLVQPDDTGITYSGFWLLSSLDNLG